MEDITPSASSHTFSKEERLTSKKIIEELFTKGSSAFLYPFRLLYLPAPSTSANTYPQVLLSVSKRNFKKAVDRNLIKRRMRETYRLNKQTLSSQIPSGQQPAFVAVVYVAKEKISFEIVEKKLILVWRRLVNKQSPA